MYKIMTEQSYHSFRSGLYLAALLLCFTVFANTASRADEEAAPMCAADDSACLFKLLTDTAAQIDHEAWRDQTWRDTARLMAQSGRHNQALALIAPISNPDTKAMTIRAIGMEAAKAGLTGDDADTLFTALRAEAEKIDHPPSYAIALTYIAMAQAFAGDDEGAITTAASMDNAALRNKAYTESAEIQAERGDLAAALTSIAAIDNPAFRNKAHSTIAHIFADQALYTQALHAAGQIDNDYQKAQSILYILGKQLAPE